MKELRIRLSERHIECLDRIAESIFGDRTSAVRFLIQQTRNGIIIWKKEDAQTPL